MNKKLHNVACKDSVWHSRLKKHAKKHSSRMLRRMLNKATKVF